MQQPQILEKPDITFVGVEASFLHALSPETNNFKVIPPLWEQLDKRACEVTGRIGKTMFGIIYSRPEGDRSHPHELQYIAASPDQQYGGFHIHAVITARNALKEIRRLRRAVLQKVAGHPM